MSLEETYGRLLVFRDALQGFVVTLEVSRAGQEAALEQVAREWDDSFQRDFEHRYAELHDPVVDFEQRARAEFLPFLDHKIAQLREYLNHG